LIKQHPLKLAYDIVNREDKSRIGGLNMRMPARRDDRDYKLLELSDLRATEKQGANPVQSKAPALNDAVLF
jgi:hypothetical protein